MQTFCLGCRAHREIKDPVQVAMKNGRPSVQGTCGVCGHKVSRIGRMPETTAV